MSDHCILGVPAYHTSTGASVGWGTKFLFMATSDSLPPAIQTYARATNSCFARIGAHQCGKLMVYARWLTASALDARTTLIAIIICTYIKRQYQCKVFKCTSWNGCQLALYHLQLAGVHMYVHTSAIYVHRMPMQYRVLIVHLSLHVQIWYRVGVCSACSPMHRHHRDIFCRVWVNLA